MPVTIGTRECPVRLSFVRLAEPAPSMDGTRKVYSCQVVIKKTDTAVLNAVKQYIQEAITKGIEKKMFSAALAKSPDFRRALRDGDQKAEEVGDGSQDYLRGCVFFNASCAENRPPGIVDRFGNKIVNVQDEVYSGCYALVAGNFFPFKHGKGGVAFGLNHVMKRAHGEHLDGFVDSDTAFKDMKDDEEQANSEADLM